MAPQPPSLTAALLAALALAACAASAPVPSGSRPGTTVPGPSTPGGSATPVPSPPPPAAPARQFRLGAAASALVAQAHTQAGSGEFAAAGATLERALRIEPDNPLLWIELGRVQLGEGNASQADGMGRKALALGTGDPAAQAAAWRLIADSLRARGRNAEALEADQHAGSAAPR